MAFPKNYRLSRKKDIDNVFRNGKTVKGSFFFIKVLKNSLGHGRGLVVISRRVARSAVQRNRIRRRILEALYGTDYMTRDIDFAIMVTTSRIDQTSMDIKEEFLNLLIHPAKTR